MNSTAPPPSQITPADIQRRMEEIRHGLLEIEARRQLEQEERQRQWAEIKAHRHRQQAERDARAAALIAHDRQLEQFAAEARRIECFTLEAAGYHRHDRGPWRRKRRGVPTVIAANDEPTTADPEPTGLQRVEAELARAGESPQTARAYFDRAARQSPATVDLFIRALGGDLIHESEQALLERMTPADPLRREAIRRQLEAMRRDLTGAERCSAIERLLIDRVVICWLSLVEAEAALIGHNAPRYDQKHWQRRFDHAQKRFLGVVRALDQVRRKVPAAQRFSLNVVGDVTIGGPATAPPTAARTIELDPST